jgi:hypothetical protein
MRHLDVIGAFCCEFLLTEVVRESSERIVPVEVINSNTKSPASKLLLNC